MEKFTANYKQVIVARAWDRYEYDKDYPILVEVKAIPRTIVRDDNTVVMNPELEEYGCIPLKEEISPNWGLGIMISSHVVWDGMGGDYRNQVTISPNDYGIYCKDPFTAYVLCRAAWK